MLNGVIYITFIHFHLLESKTLERLNKLYNKSVFDQTIIKEEF